MGVVNQQPDDDRPDIAATLVPSLEMARLDDCVCIEIPSHGVTDALGVGTMISGLMPEPPTSVVPATVVASPKVDEVMALGLSSPEAAPVSEELVVIAAPVGLHALDRIDVPNGETTGDDALDRDDADANPDIPIVLLASTAALVAEFAIPVVGHIAIVPRGAAGIGPKLPRLS
jgi:hypothetical protein